MLPALGAQARYLIPLRAARSTAHVQHTRRRPPSNRPTRNEKLTRQRRKTHYILQAAVIQAGVSSRCLSESLRFQLMKSVTNALPQVACGPTGNRRFSLPSKPSSHPPKFSVTMTFKSFGAPHSLMRFTVDFSSRCRAASAARRRMFRAMRVVSFAPTSASGLTNETFAAISPESGCARAARSKIR